jgi:peptidoglycan/LPS O-acetylase OafA/YrhL
MEAGNASAPAITRRHFHTFDALRFFAFFKVFLLHLPIATFPWFSFFSAGGGIGVQFFFVLSGFLITYIICEEKQRTGKLNLRNFFIRRILRIWPLYYLMVAVAFATPYLLSKAGISASGQGYEPTWWVSVLFLENYKMIFTGSTPNVSPLTVMWSLCIEEHFYIVWGILLYRLRVGALPKLIGICIVVAIIARVAFAHYHLPSNDIFTNIDLFALGAIPAYLLVRYPEKLEAYVQQIALWKKRLFTAGLVVVVLIASQTTSEVIYIWLTTVLGALFAILIMLTIPADSRFRISDKNVLSRMGVYTYGLYLYHTLVINLLRVIWGKVGLSLDEWKGATLFAITALMVTLLCSMLSYYAFERQFLKLKRFFR